jgi:ACS family glucarate transporter-like MFS transporter
VAAAVSARRAWPGVALLCATATAAYLCRVNVSVVGALLMQEFDLTQAQLGRVFSAFLLGYALFMVPGGLAADRWGTRRVLELASWWWVVATALQLLVGQGPLGAASTSALWALLALRFLLGIGEAPTFPAAARGVSRWITPERQGRANGLVIAAIAVGSAIAPPLLSAVMVPWGWRAALLVSAVPALATAIAWRLAQEPAEAAVVPRSETQKVPGGPGSLRSPAFILLTLSYSLQGYVGYVFVFWFYLYLVQERHFDFLKGGMLSSLPWLLSMLSIPLGGWISDRLVARHGATFGRRAVPLVGLTLAGVFLSVGARTANGYVAAVSLALSTALVLSVEGPFWATMIGIAGARSGAAGGIMNTGSNIGGLVSPALTPLLAEAIGWENALQVAAVLSVVAALLWLGITPETRAPDAVKRDPSAPVPHPSRASAGRRSAGPADASSR